MNKVSIDINGRFLGRQSTGIDRFAMEVLRSWLALTKDRLKVRLLTPRHDALKASGVFDIPATGIGPGTGHYWEQFALAKHSHGNFLLNLCNTAPLWKRKQLVVLHDASVMANPDAFALLYRKWHQQMSSVLMKRTNVIASVSKFSAGELARFFGVRSSDIEVIYESGEHILRHASDRSILSRLGLGNGVRYILAVGSRSKNKNFSAIVRAAEQLKDMNIKVVTAGGSNSRVFAGSVLQSDNLILAGYVSDAELRALYENAECFVFPSYYEGFGLPPLEAMHCGCPTLVSNVSAVPEICGNASLYCNPHDPTDVAKQLKRLLTSKSLQSELKEAGLERVKDFTWRRAAESLNQLVPA